MPDTTGKPTARTSAAAGNKSTSFDIAASGDKCFLCGRTIAEAAPIGFYLGKKAMMRCHRGCLDIMEMHGGKPADFHRFMEAKQKKQPPVHDKPTVFANNALPGPVDGWGAPREPVHQDIESAKAQVEASVEEYRGPRSVMFESFADLQTYIATKGPFPEHVRVAIGAYVVQAGG